MGVFIVVEGPEGAGKSTLVRWLAARLVAEGLPARAVRQPGGTPVAEAARKVALKFPHAMSPVAELFLFLAARADLVQRVIPALACVKIDLFIKLPRLIGPVAPNNRAFLLYGHHTTSPTRTSWR